MNVDEAYVPFASLYASYVGPIQPASVRQAFLRESPGTTKAAQAFPKVGLYLLFKILVHE